MGLFSSEYKYYAFAGTSPLFDEDNRPDTVQSRILQTTIESGGVSLAEAIQFGINTNLYARAKAMLRYADKSYIRGFPTSNQISIHIDENMIFSVIETDAGEPIDNLSWIRAGRLDEIFVLNKHLKEVYLDTNYFPWPDGNPDDIVWDEYKEFVEIPVVDPTTGKYYITENTPIFRRRIEGAGFVFEDVRDLPADQYAELLYLQEYDNKYKISYAYTDSIGDPAIWDMPLLLDMTQYNAGSWIQVRYQTAANPDITEYWTYLIGSGDNPALEATIEIQSRYSEFLPVAVLMQDKVWFDEDPDSELAITTNRLLKKLGSSGTKMKKEFIEAVAEDDADPDTAKSNAEKWDFFIHFACPIDTQIKGSLEYLYEFFQDIAFNQQHNFQDYQIYLGSSSTAQPVSEMIIKEAGVNGYNVAYRWSYIYTKVFSGTFVVDGEPLENKEMHSEMYERTATNEVEYKVGLEEVHGPGILIGNYSDTPETGGYHDYIVITRQWEDENSNPFYTRVLVLGLSMQYTINVTDPVDKTYAFRYAEPAMFGDEEETKEFRIPIHARALKRVPVMHREECLGDSLCATVFLVERIKVKWYQKSFFKWLIVIIAIVLIVLTIMNPGLWEFTAQVIGYAIGTTSAFAIYAIYVVLMFAVGYVISFAGSLIGGTWGKVFILVAMIAMNYQKFNVGDAWRNFSENAGWGTAGALLSSIQPYVQIGQVIYEDRVMAKLEAEMRDFMQNAKEQQQELQDAWDSFEGSPSWLDPMDLIASFRRVNYRESPDSYYGRVLNPNPGLLGYDLVNNFSAIALTLPEDGQSTNMVLTMFDDLAQQRGQV